MLPVVTTALLALSLKAALKPQPLPAFLEPYSEKALMLTEAALGDDALKVTRGIAYGPEAHQTLDVWAPAVRPSAPMPIVIGIHGGGWEFGYPEWAGFGAQAVCAAPALYITPAYALGLGERQAWPASRDDLLAALRWVVDHATDDEFGGDPSRLVITGHSAGAHLSACLGLDPPLLRAAGVPPSAVKALFLVSGPVGLRAQDFAPRRWLWRFWVGRPLINWLYRKVAPNLRAVVDAPVDPAAVLAASPLARLAEQDPAALPPLVHVAYGGKGDFPFCKPQAMRLQAELGRLGADGSGPRVEVLELEGCDHFGTHWALADMDGPWCAALREVLRDI